MVNAQDTRIGILVYDGVDLLDVAVPFELFNWAASADSTLSVRLVAAEKVNVTTRDHFRFVADDIIHDEYPQLGVVWIPGADPTFLAKAMEDETILGFLGKQAAGAARRLGLRRGIDPGGSRAARRL